MCVCIKPGMRCRKQEKKETAGENDRNKRALTGIIPGIQGQIQAVTWSCFWADSGPLVDPPTSRTLQDVVPWTLAAPTSSCNLDLRRLGSWGSQWAACNFFVSCCIPPLHRTEARTPGPPPSCVNRRLSDRKEVHRRLVCHAQRRLTASWSWTQQKPNHVASQQADNVTKEAVWIEDGGLE